MLIELGKKLPLEDCLFAEEEPKFVDASMFQDIEINVFDFFFIEVLFDDVKHFLVFEGLLADV